MKNVAYLVPDVNEGGSRFVGHVLMTSDEWAEVADNPRQRDTEKRASRAKHLFTPAPTHQSVAMATLPSGERYKLDGHTRSHLWATGAVPAPKTLSVAVYACRTIAEVKELYRHFDSKQATEHATDEVFGGLRELGLSFQSELLKSLRFRAALTHVHGHLFGFNETRGASTYDVLAYWQPELILFDGCNPTRKRYPTGIAAAALATLRRHGPQAAPFWSRYSRGLGEKFGGEMDAVQGLEERVVGLAGKSGGTYANALYQFSCGLSAYLASRANYRYSIGAGGGVRSLAPATVREFVIAAKSTPRAW